MNKNIEDRRKTKNSWRKEVAILGKDKIDDCCVIPVLTFFEVGSQ